MNTKEEIEIDHVSTDEEERESYEKDMKKRSRDEIKYRRRIYIFEREKEIDWEIQKRVKRWLRSNRQFDVADNKSEATHLLLFQRSDLSQFHLIPREKFNDKSINIPYQPLITKIYIRRIHSF